MTIPVAAAKSPGLGFYLAEWCFWEFAGGKGYRFFRAVLYQLSFLTIPCFLSCLLPQVSPRHESKSSRSGFPACRSQEVRLESLTYFPAKVIWQIEFRIGYSLVPQ